MHEQLTKELYETKIELLRVKRHLLAVDNDAMRLKIKMNAQARRQLKNEIQKLHSELQPKLPF